MSEKSDASPSTTETDPPKKKPFVEPEVSEPKDVLEATSSFLSGSPAVTVTGGT